MKEFILKTIIVVIAFAICTQFIPKSIEIHHKAGWQDLRIWHYGK